MSRAALVLIVAACAACGSPRPAPVPPPPPGGYDARELAEIADGIYDVLDTMAAIVEQRVGDCPGMGRDLAALFDKSAPIFARAKQVAADPKASTQLADEMRRHDEMAPATADRINEGLKPCAGDSSVQAAMARMPVL